MPKQDLVQPSSKREGSSRQSLAGIPLGLPALNALLRAVLPDLAYAAMSQGNAAGIAFSWLSISTAVAAETPQLSWQDVANIRILQNWSSYLAYGKPRAFISRVGRPQFSYVLLPCG